MLLSEKDYITKKRKELEQLKKSIERLKKGNFRANELKTIKVSYEYEQHQKKLGLLRKDSHLVVNRRRRFADLSTKELYIEYQEKKAKDLEAEIKYRAEALRVKEEKKDIKRLNDYIGYAIGIGFILMLIYAAITR